MILTEKAKDIFATANKDDSSALSENIKDFIAQQNGQISFADFMQQALYFPKLGYYASNSIKFGPKGDFVTAPEIGKLFSLCLAKQIQQILSSLDNENAAILEFGGGTGKLAGQLLRTLNADKPKMFNKYYILEISGTLKARQQQHILDTCPEYFHQVTWLETMPTQAITGVIIANEVMDAMPVTRFQKSINGWEELCVSYDKKFCWSARPAQDELLSILENPKWQKHLSILEDNYQSEINLALPAWIKTIANILDKGSLLLFDYGFPRKEYYHPDRKDGTLMCHYNHYSHSDPLLYPGLQDITAHVDFTTVAEAATKEELSLLGYTNLASFLMDCGLINIINEKSYNFTQEINLLTSPAEMGELFKVIACARNFTAPLIGFDNFCKLHTL